MSRLDDIAEQIQERKQPPVHLWKPENVGDIDIRIDSNGFWFHEGDPITRQQLVNLFASILWFEDEDYYLVTPVEKLKIEVEDVPFIVHQMEHVDDSWVAVTNNHEQVIIDSTHPVKLNRYQDQWLPYICVRYDLWARVNRSIYYQWVNAAMEQQQSENDPLMLESQDYRFEVARA